MVVSFYNNKRNTNHDEGEMEVHLSTLLIKQDTECAENFIQLFLHFLNI